MVMKSKTASVDVKFDGSLSCNEVQLVVLDILKFLLYQRHQIPQPIDILEKDFAFSISQNNTNQDPLQQEAECGSNRERIKQKQIERKQKWRREKWLRSLERFLTLYQKITKYICEEIQSGQVSAIQFILGGSIFTAKETYTIHLPSEYDLTSATLTSRQCSLKLFRSVMSNENLMDVIDRKIVKSKMWILLQKNICNELTNTPREEEDICIIKRPNFTPLNRAKAVTFNLSHTVPQLYSNDPMEFTPCVETHKKKTSRLRSRRSSFMGCESTPGPGLYCAKGKIGTEDSFKTPRMVSNRVLERGSLIKSRSKRIIDTNQINTDVKPGQDEDFVPFTPRNQNSVLRRLMNNNLRQDIPMEETPIVTKTVLKKSISWKNQQNKKSNDSLKENTRPSEAENMDNINSNIVKSKPISILTNNHHRIMEYSNSTKEKDELDMLLEDFSNLHTSSLTNINSIYSSANGLSSSLGKDTEVLHSQEEHNLSSSLGKEIEVSTSLQDKYDLGKIDEMFEFVPETLNDLDISISEEHVWYQISSPINHLKGDLLGRVI